MADRLIGRMQGFYKRLEKLDGRAEALLVWGFFSVLVFGVVLGMGTLTSGFHLVDDWEFAKYVDWMTLEGRSVADCLREAVGYDLTMRFRPLYYINRVLMAAVFGINLTAMSVIKAAEIVAAFVLLYYCARRMRCNMVYAALFSLTVLTGYQSAVWWKLGPQESYDIMMFALGFWLMLKWLRTGRRWYAAASVGAFFLMSIYKEPFILLLPFVGLYVLYEEMTGKKVTLSALWAAIRRRLPFLMALGLMFAAEMFLIVFVIGTNNYSYVGLDESVTLEQYAQAWALAAHTDLKWYVRFGWLFILLFLTYWEHVKKLGWEMLLAFSIILPQCVSYSKTAMTERYLLPAVHGRVVLREAAYFTYRGESIRTMMESTLALVKGTDKKVLSCFAPNLEGNRTMYYWFRLQGYDEVFYWEEEEKKINRSFGPREDEQAAFEEIDVIVMYNREDRHWCYEPSLDLSGFTEKVCGTITMYVRD